MVVRQGAAADSLYVIRSGQVCGLACMHACAHAHARFDHAMRHAPLDVLSHTLSVSDPRRPQVCVLIDPEYTSAAAAAAGRGPQELEGILPEQDLRRLVQVRTCMCCVPLSLFNEGRGLRGAGFVPKGESGRCGCGSCSERAPVVS